ncbi:MAG TPA: hypothetical protein VGP44_11630, partial [Gemmatimonadales bacterium]|nr:hypothetical protein [Gemmatimonadales bacterium]
MPKESEAMSDETTKDQPKSLDALHRQWVKTVEDALVTDHGVHRPYAKASQKRLVTGLSSATGGSPARALDPSGNFYPVENPDYPLGAFIRHLAAGVPDEYRLEAVQE